MHDAIIAASFVLMVLAPCLVATKCVTTEA